MNYCNSDWINNGLLSEGDVLGTRTVYGYAKAVGIRSINGNFLQADNGGGTNVYADRTTINRHEEFRMVPQSNGKVALQSAYGYFVRAEGGGGSDLVADRTKVGSHESSSWSTSAAARSPWGRTPATTWWPRAAAAAQ